jgi:hypothetical protein
MPKKLNFCTFLNNHFPSKRLKESKVDKKIEVCSAACPKELKNGSSKLNMSSIGHGSPKNTSKCLKSSTIFSQK